MSRNCEGRSPDESTDKQQVRGGEEQVSGGNPGAEPSAIGELLPGGAKRLGDTQQQTEYVIPGDISGPEWLARAIFERSPLPVFVTAESGLRFNYVNPRLADLLGFDRQELLDRNLFQIVADQDDLKRALDLFYLQGKRLNEHDLAFKTSAGSRITLSLSMQQHPMPGYLECLALDVTRRTQAEVALRHSEQKYRELYQNLRDGIVAVDLNGRVLECNRVVESMLGYTQDELRQTDCRSLTPSKWHELEDRIVREQLRVRGYSDVYEKEFIRKDGVLVPVELTMYHMKNDHGEPIGVWAIIRDITVRKRTEEELRRSHQQLTDEQENLRRKNAALEEILSQVGSERRELSRSIRANIDRVTEPLMGSLLESAENESDRHYLLRLKRSLEEITSPFVSNMERHHSRLSPREIEIANLIRSGYKTREIASILNLSVHTVLTQRKQIRRKLGITSEKVNLISFLKSLG